MGPSVFYFGIIFLSRFLVSVPYNLYEDRFTSNSLIFETAIIYFTVKTQPFRLPQQENYFLSAQTLATASSKVTTFRILTGTKKKVSTTTCDTNSSNCKTSNNKPTSTSSRVIRTDRRTMISLKSELSLVLLLATSAKVAAFDSKKCDVYVFRTHENALWHCGEKLPETDGTSLYCDHSQGDGSWPWPWASNHANDWCKFMISTVWGQDEGHYSLTPEIDYNDTPGPNIYVLEKMTDWGCYMVEDGVVTESYLVDSRQGKVASDVNDQCDRVTNYFDYQNMHPAIRDIQWSGATPDTGKSSQQNRQRK